MNTLNFYMFGHLFCPLLVYLIRELPRTTSKNLPVKYQSRYITSNQRQ